MKNFSAEIYTIRPRYEKTSKENIIDRYSKTRGSLDDRPVFTQNWQPFAWAAIIGFINNRRRPLSTPLADPFGEFGIINNNGPLISKALICFAIAKSEIGIEILRDAKQVISIIEEYANGGFDFINEVLQEKGDTYFDSFDNFIVELLNR